MWRRVPATSLSVMCGCSPDSAPRRHLSCISWLIRCTGFAGELPLAAAGGVGYVWIAAEAAAFDPVVDGLGEAAVLDFADALAGMPWHALALARLLHAAFLHRVYELPGHIFAGRFVYVGVEPEGKGAFKPFEPRMVAEPEESLYPLRLYHCEALPRPCIMEHRRVHAFGLLDRLEPHAVHGQPVFGIVLY